MSNYQINHTCYFSILKGSKRKLSLLYKSLENLIFLIVAAVGEEHSEVLLFTCDLIDFLFYNPWMFYRFPLIFFSSRLILISISSFV